MRIGFDIDGVLANFSWAFSQRLIKQFGNRFPADMNLSDPPMWDWFYPHYTPEEVKATFNYAHTDPFWYRIGPHIDNVTALALVIKDLEHRHDIYFVTNRTGANAKRHTEAWLSEHLPYDEDVTPTVLLVGDKGAAAKALKLDVYLDDNLPNALDVLKESPKTRMYLLDKSYNQGDAAVEVPTTGSVFSPTERREATRVPTLAAMLDLELPNL